ncbi:Diaminohydroxyphosphoribosylaminopyrimidine deaminase / 5-amino-6-(5-phosphoribosylamino)uracil reductase [hydrothermal vent metagenome]|uniref:Diaminohydroxyphosphoribosylaminopyrimidine deaminase / 5-amino-6-(5-phosphoribosylamino)uracil reductase n=1 Tax=hydrothermal vent metagenome TaxID=652676 RepID=A0A3B0WQU1_9ZZZZ
MVKKNNTVMISEFSADDQRYMQQALTLAQKGRYSTKPNPAVGCVLVKDGQVVGVGWHKLAGQHHAERYALEQAGKLAFGATAYVTLEPCSHFGRTSPCSNALIEGGVKKVYIAMLDPNPLVSGQGVQKLQQAGIEVQVGLLESDAQALNRGFVRRMEHGLPYVILKMASSLDGRTALQNGKSKWITGAESRLEVHKLRAASGAIITGIGTVLADDPSLTVRLPSDVLNEMNLEQTTAQPLRVVFDSTLNMPLNAKILNEPGHTLIVIAQDTADKKMELVQSFKNRGVTFLTVSYHAGKLDLQTVLHHLAKIEQINTVMVESGATLAGDFLAQNAVDELHSFIAPCVLGNQAKPMFVLPTIQNMDDKIQLQTASVAQFGEDVRIVFHKR